MPKTTKKVAKATDDSQKAVNVPKKIVPKDVDPNEIITVYNGFQGKLVYISPRTKETFRWNEFGDTQEMEIRELRNAKSSAKKFFINNWFMFDEDDAWIINYLGVSQYYKNALRLEEFDKLFSKDPASIQGVISKLSNGQKKSIAYRARILIAEGEIDSNKVIAALEKSLGVNLIER